MLAYDAILKECAIERNAYVSGCTQANGPTSIMRWRQLLGPTRAADEPLAAYEMTIHSL